LGLRGRVFTDAIIIRAGVRTFGGVVRVILLALVHRLIVIIVAIPVVLRKPTFFAQLAVPVVLDAVVSPAGQKRRRENRISLDTHNMIGALR
jgi:membrane glycosyltransferase